MGSHCIYELWGPPRSGVSTHPPLPNSATIAKLFTRVSPCPCLPWSALVLVLKALCLGKPIYTYIVFIFINYYLYIFLFNVSFVFAPRAKTHSSS